jgi:hypothetical protein
MTAFSHIWKEVSHLGTVMIIYLWVGIFPSGSNISLNLVYFDVMRLVNC